MRQYALCLIVLVGCLSLAINFPNLPIPTPPQGVPLGASLLDLFPTSPAGPGTPTPPAALGVGVGSHGPSVAWPGFAAGCVGVGAYTRRLLGQLSTTDVLSPGELTLIRGIVRFHQMCLFLAWMIEALLQREGLPHFAGAIFTAALGLDVIGNLLPWWVSWVRWITGGVLTSATGVYVCNWGSTALLVFVTVCCVCAFRKIASLVSGLLARRLFMPMRHHLTRILLEWGVNPQIFYGALGGSAVLYIAQLVRITSIMVRDPVSAPAQLLNNVELVSLVVDSLPPAEGRDAGAERSYWLAGCLFVYVVSAVVGAVCRDLAMVALDEV